MSPEDIDKLTIAEVRAIAERAAAALDTLRALGLTGGAAGAQPAQTHPLAPVVLPVQGPPTRTRTPLSDADAAEMAARKAALLAQNLPDDIARAERTPSP